MDYVLATKPSHLGDGAATSKRSAVQAGGVHDFWAMTRYVIVPMRKWLQQYGALSRNAFVVALGSPFSLVLALTILSVQAFLGALPFFTFGEQLRLVRDQSLALCLLGGCLAAGLGAAIVFVEDIRNGAAPVVMSRPVSGFCFVAGKWSGLVLSLAVIHSLASVGCLWLTKITASAETLDSAGLSLYVGAVVVALVVMAVKHYLLGGCYVWQANVALVVCFLLAFSADLGLGQFTAEGAHGFGGVDWQTGKACLQVFFCLVVFSGVMALLATVADVGLLLTGAVLVFFCGMLSETAIRSLLGNGLPATFARVVLPNWQLYWVNDTLAEGRAVPWAYVMRSSVHAFCYCLVALVVATWFFRRHELEGRA